jgi:hypothetical protein
MLRGYLCFSSKVSIFRGHSGHFFEKFAKDKNIFFAKDFDSLNILKRRNIRFYFHNNVIILSHLSVKNIFMRKPLKSGKGKVYSICIICCDCNKRTPSNLGKGRHSIYIICCDCNKPFIGFVENERFSI